MLIELKLAGTVGVSSVCEIRRFLTSFSARGGELVSQALALSASCALQGLKAELCCELLVSVEIGLSFFVRLI